MIKNEPKRRLGDFMLSGHPYVKAEVVYAVRYEWARRAEDIIARRTRLAFLNKVDAINAIPIVVDLMGEELNWSTSRKKEEINRCTEFMTHFGGPVPK